MTNRLLTPADDQFVTPTTRTVGVTVIECRPTSDHQIPVRLRVQAAGYVCALFSRLLAKNPELFPPYTRP